MSKSIEYDPDLTFDYDPLFDEWPEKEKTRELGSSKMHDDYTVYRDLQAIALKVYMGDVEDMGHAESGILMAELKQVDEELRNKKREMYEKSRMNYLQEKRRIGDNIFSVEHQMSNLVVRMKFTLEGLLREGLLLLPYTFTQKPSDKPYIFYNRKSHRIQQTSMPAYCYLCNEYVRLSENKMRKHRYGDKHQILFKSFMDELIIKAKDITKKRNDQMREAERLKAICEEVDDDVSGDEIGKKSDGNQQLRNAYQKSINGSFAGVMNEYEYFAENDDRHASSAKSGNSSRSGSSESVPGPRSSSRDSKDSCRKNSGNKRKDSKTFDLTTGLDYQHNRLIAMLFPRGIPSFFRCFPNCPDFPIELIDFPNYRYDYSISLNRHEQGHFRLVFEGSDGARRSKPDPLRKMSQQQKAWEKSWRQKGNKEITDISAQNANDRVKQLTEQAFKDAGCYDSLDAQQEAFAMQNQWRATGSAAVNRNLPSQPTGNVAARRNSSQAKGTTIANDRYLQVSQKPAPTTRYWPRRW